MKITPAQLASTLQKSLPTAWLVTGDEPLLVQEACDSIRATARQQDFSERCVFHADNHLNWSSVSEELNSLSLFSERKRVEIHLPSGKTGQGSAVLERYLESASDDILLLLISPRLDSGELRKRWYKLIQDKGALVQIWPIEPNRFPDWLNQRARQQGLRLTQEALQTLVERVEGNLLAAAQELDRLRLLCPDGQLDERLVEESVLDSARFNAAELIGEALAGRIPHALRMLEVLREEGTHPLPILTLLARQLRLTLALRRWQASGQIDKLFFDQQRIKARNQIQPLERASRRLNEQRLYQILALCTASDQAIKGLSTESPWRLLATMIGSMDGQPNFLTHLHFP